MRVFVTGATGFIGSAIVPDLIRAGHDVVGLARSDTAAAALSAAGAKVHRGDLTDLGSLRAGAAAADGVVHTAFVHDFDAHEAAVETERLAVGALGEALADSGRPLVVTSGVAALAPGRVGTEGDDPPASWPRGVSETTAWSFADRGVRVSVVRLSPSVHGEGDHGFVPALIDIARRTGVSGYPGDGANRWAAVHRLDAAPLFRLALESAPAGARLHGVAEEGVPVREIAEVIGRRLGLPVTSIAPEDVAGHFGWMGRFITLDGPASSALTTEQYGWRPVQPGLLADLDAGHYFRD